VTDANVILGLIDPENYLKGRHTLDRAAAVDVVRSRIGEPLGWTPEHAAAAIYDLAVIEMANALRMVSIERGHHPRDFTFFSYGGGLGLFGVEIARRLGCPRIVVPDNSSAFSAYGVLIADYVRQYDRTVGWVLSDPSQAAHVNAVAAEMIAQALEDAREEGIAESELELERSGDFRFLGQVYEVNVPLPARELTPADAPALAEDFPRIYERNYGEGTAWEGSPVVMMNLSIKATNRRAKPAGRNMQANGAVAPKPAKHRQVFLPIERREASVPVYAEAALAPGSSVAGPAILDLGDTTVYVPEGASASRDEHFNFLLSV
jgi:N-methylhydantoinase A